MINVKTFGMLNSMSKEDIKEDVEVRENANFSTMAHDNYLEVIQLLAERLIINEEDADTLGNASEGLRLKDLTKYRCINFKNPF